MWTYGIALQNPFSNAATSMLKLPLEEVRDTWGVNIGTIWYVFVQISKHVFPRKQNVWSACQRGLFRCWKMEDRWANSELWKCSDRKWCACQTEWWFHVGWKLNIKLYNLGIGCMFILGVKQNKNTYRYRSSNTFKHWLSFIPSCVTLTSSLSSKWINSILIFSQPYFSIYI